MTAPRRLRPVFRPTLAPLLLVALGACSGGGDGPGQGDPLAPGDGPPELVFVRSRRDAADRDTGIRESLLNGLGNERVLAAGGVESGVRVHPDGNRLLFTRERRTGQPETREIFTGSRDGTVGELRLTVNSDRDERPDWSRDGARVVFVSDRLGAGPRLFEAMADGSNPVALHDDGADQLDPDWSPVDDRIVFARVEAGRARLHLLQEDRRFVLPLTDGGSGTAAGRIVGDLQPCWGPEGRSVWFTRVLGDESAVLCRVGIMTGTVTVLTDPADDAGRPRVSPDAEQLLFTMRRPGLGMTGERLWRARADGSELRLLFPDQRYDYLGFDLLPDFPSLDTTTVEDVAVQITEGALRNGLGRQTRGSLDFILEADDVLYGLATVPSGNREVAGIDLGVPLPLESPYDLRRIDVTVRAAITETGPEDLLRIAVRNATEGRNDTVVELPPSGSMQTVRFALSSLAHIDRDRGFALAVIADKARDLPGELLIDSIELSVRRPVADQQ